MQHDVTIQTETVWGPQQALKIARLAGLVLAIALAGCARNKPQPTAAIDQEVDYRERHPIIITDAPHKLDIYPIRSMGGLDLRQNDDVKAFAAEYRAAGHGPLTIELPNGAEPHAMRESLAGIRKALASSGVTARYVRTGSYYPDYVNRAAPVRLSFSKLQAKVDSRCGQWRTDMMGSSTSEEFSNTMPPNFGCAFQSVLAEQVANPVDLIRPRQEGPVDIDKREQDIQSLRQHKDPSTEWKATAQSFGTFN
jgi:pilus assembly protein CpaD